MKFKTAEARIVELYQALESVAQGERVRLRSLETGRLREATAHRDIAINERLELEVDEG